MQGAVHKVQGSETFWGGKICEWSEAMSNL
jgi:hypothetical protein